MSMMQRVAGRWLAAALTFRDERSPRIGGGARRFVLNDSSAEPPERRDTLFRDQYRRYQERAPYKRLKKPVLEYGGVTEPGDIAYIDYTGGKKDVYIHLIIVREGIQGGGIATKLLREFYKRMFPDGKGVARWGRILNPTSYHLFEKMREEWPEVTHMGGKFF